MRKKRTLTFGWPVFLFNTCHIHRYGKKLRGITATGKVLIFIPINRSITKDFERGSRYTIRAGRATECDRVQSAFPSTFYPLVMNYICNYAFIHYICNYALGRRIEKGLVIKTKCILLPLVGPVEEILNPLSQRARNKRFV